VKKLSIAGLLLLVCGACTGIGETLSYIPTDDVVTDLPAAVEEVGSGDVVPTDTSPDQVEDILQSDQFSPEVTDVSEPPDLTVETELPPLLDVVEVHDLPDYAGEELEDQVDDPADLPQETAAEIPDVVEVEETVDPIVYVIPCEDHADCNQKGLCLENITGAKLCYPWCETDDDCPDLFLCDLPSDFEDKACFPIQPQSLCMACDDDEDCVPDSFPAEATCVNYGGVGKFCGTECTTDTEIPCPVGYVCNQLAGTDDDPQYRCMPKPGDTCACEPFMEGMASSCYKENFWGKCVGSKTCVDGVYESCTADPPAPEECNGIDDDCDGVVDEDQDELQLTCIINFDAGSCKVRQQCVDGGWVCPDIPFVEICGQEELECFWFSGVEDTDNDEYPDFCDPDDDGDGFDDVDDCEPLDPESFPGAEEFCDGVDNDCNGVSDYSQLGQDFCVSENEWGSCNGKGFCIDGEWVCDPPAPGPDHCPEEGEDCSFVPLSVDVDADQDGTPDFCDMDNDGDGVPDANDNCPDLYNPNQFDLDQDDLGDGCDDDDDNDTVPDAEDCCPYVFDPSQLNSDDDEICDGCDDDDDNDGIKDVADNCQFVVNPGQEDNDEDGDGDLCDKDDDNDSVKDDKDNCPFISNLFQKDSDNDKSGDVCDDDDDNDDKLDDEDNCPLVFNPGQENLDSDEFGNVCDLDIDGDDTDEDGDGSGSAGDNLCTGGETENCDDNCPVDNNPDQADLDGDSIGDACDTDIDGDGDGNSLDNCLYVPNPAQEDMDDDCPPTPFDADPLCGDICDEDIDGDGINEDGDGSGVKGDNFCTGGATENCDDNCPATYNPDQADMDSNGLGNACSNDKDGDGHPDDEDNCPKTSNPGQENTDDDPLGDACDADDDNDGVFDPFDNCPLIPNPGQEDVDDDGKGDACDE